MFSAGSILWLPHKQDIPHGHTLATEGLDGCFNHPVLILAADHAGNEAVVLIVRFRLYVSYQA